MTESPLVDSGLAVLVFSPGDDLIACLNKAMSFLTAVASSWFPSTNNQLRTSSNPRNQATIQDVLGKTMQVDRKGLLNATTIKEAAHILDEEQLAFLADLGIPNNAAFQTEDLDTYDSDCDDISNLKAVLMANISNYSSDVISEVPHSETYLNDMENQSVHAMQDFEQTPAVDVTDNEITKLSAEQAFWLRMSNPTSKPSDASPVKIEAPKVSLVNENLKKLKFHLSRFDNVVKIRTTPDARTKDEWGFEHTKAVFNNEIIPFLKSLKDIFNVFDKDLLNEIMEVQTVFDQMDAVVQQSSVDKQCLEITKKELLLENDPTFTKIIVSRFSLSVMNSMSLIGESVNIYRKRKESCDKCFNLEAELLKSQNAHNDLLKSYSQLEKHCISLELSIQLNQEIFQKDKSCNNQNALEIPEFFENNDLKAQLQDKDTTIYKLKDIIKSMREKSKEENVNYDYGEIETKNIELENSVVFKEQFDSIKKTRVRTKEQSDSLIDKLNLKSAENEDLKAQIQDKVFVITSLKNDLRKLKGKEIVDIVAQTPSAYTIVPGMFKLELEHLAPRSYLYMFEILVLMRLNLTRKRLLSHPKTLSRKLGLKCSTSNCGSKPTGNKKNDRISRTPSRNMKNKVEAQPRKVNKKNSVVEPIHDVDVKHSLLNVNSEPIYATCKKSMFDGVHDKCLLDFVENVNSSTFTIVGNSCPLTRITSSNVVPPKKTTSHSVETQKPKLKVYSRKPKNVKNVGSSKKAKIVESKNAKHLEPNHTWGSNASDIPSSSFFVMTVVQIVLWYLDSGFSKHMTWNRSQLMNFVSKFLGTIRFRNDHIARIMGYGDYQLGNVTISRVYYVKGLGHNFFSVGQFCDAELEVAFWKNSCFIRNLDGYYERVGISHETSVARTPQQNDVVERRNRTLVEAARTMLIFAKAPLFLWDEAIATASKADIGIFIGYAPKKKAYRIYNRRTRKIIETIHVDFDELTAMASEQLGSGPGLQCMTPATPSSGLVPNPPPSAPFVPPSRHEWDLVFQPVFDEFFSPPASVASPVPVEEAPAPVESTSSPSSTTVDQDAPSPSTSQTTPQSQSQTIPLSAEEESHDLEVAHMSNDPYFGIPIPETVSEESSSSDVISTTVHSDAPISEHLSKWTKDHPLQNIIGDPSRPVSTRLQLHEQALFCYYDAFLTSVEPKTYKDALTQSCWIEAMQEELHEFERLEVWELVPRLDKVMEEGIDFEESFAPVDRLEAVQIFLAFATHMNMIVYQMDVKRHLNGNPYEREVYIITEEGEAKLSPGYKIYVDDIIFASTTELCDKFSEIMCSKFKMSMMGKISFFLGLQISQSPRGIFLNQSKYALESLKKYEWNLETQWIVQEKFKLDNGYTRDNSCDATN
ncbi:retrovirus-related pol polyprotein from transposon TNT 1-94 [Tanacetum coccineum]